MEVDTPLEEFGIGIESEAAPSDDGVEFLDGLEVSVCDRLVEYGPETFGRLQLGRIGRQVDEAEAFRHREVRRRVPPGAVDHQDDDAALPSAGLAGEEGEQLLEEWLGDTIGDVPKGLSAGRRDEGGDVEPI